jgi:hypothetical protein
MPSEIDRQGSRHALLAAATAAVDAQSQHDGQHPPGQSGALKRVLVFPDSPRRPRPRKCMCRCTCISLTAPVAQEHHSEETAGLDLLQRQSCVARDTPATPQGPAHPPRAGSCGRAPPALACAPTGAGPGAPAAEGPAAPPGMRTASRRHGPDHHPPHRRPRPGREQQPGIASPCRVPEVGMPCDLRRRPRAAVSPPQIMS